jgi:hypothetical protein
MAIAPVPRIVNGGQFAVADGAVIWSCHNNAFACFEPSEQASEGIGGTPVDDKDCVARVRWYREFAPPRVSAWLTADPAGDPVAFTATHAFRTASGGYVATERDAVYRFPLERVQLATGDCRFFTLAVPFDGKVSKPETNTRSAKGADGEETVHTWGPHLLGVTGLGATSDSLQICIGTERGSKTLKFPLAVLESP